MKMLVTFADLVPVFVLHCSTHTGALFKWFVECVLI